MSTYSDLDDSGLLPHSKPRTFSRGVRNDSYSDQSDLSYDSAPSFDSTSQPAFVEIIWSDGPLGLTLRRVGEKNIVVSRITGKGESKSLQMLCRGDTLQCINNFQTSEIGSSKAMQLLKALPKPVYLKFCLQRTEEEI